MSLKYQKNKDKTWTQFIDLLASIASSQVFVGVWTIRQMAASFPKGFADLNLYIGSISQMKTTF